MIYLLIVCFIILIFNKNNRYKTLKVIYIAVICISILFIWFEQSRKFYCLSDNKCITVWKRYGNECYIIPYKYYGIVSPDNNYIKITNDNALTIIYSGDDKYDYIIFNNYGKNIEFKINKYKVKYYDYSEGELFHNKYYGEQFIKPQYKYILINMEENFVIINGISQ